MEPDIFFEHYRVIEPPLGRVGLTTKYRAIDTRTGETVMLQLIPSADVDQSKRLQFEERVRLVKQLDHINVARVLRVESDKKNLGLVSEFAEGETAESWITHHGPMAPDAVLRIGLQVVRALGAAAFFGLHHRTLEPANIMIMRGELAEGGWPFVKLLNFGLAGLAIYDEPREGKDAVSLPPSSFASPEQLRDQPVDFRSEIYSLGAIMCFLLTGAVLDAKARLRARRLPELRRAPAALRDVLVHMLRENPEDRPQDPAAFETELAQALRKVEKRQAFGRRIGVPLATVIPRPIRSTTERSTTVSSPMTQVIRGAVAFAALIIVGAIVAAFLLPEDVIPFRHRNAEEIGVPIGVPSPVVIPSPTQSPPVVANNFETPPPVASVAQTPDEPMPPAQGPDFAQNPPNESAPSPMEEEQTPPPPASTPVKKKIVSARSTSSPPASAPREPGVHARVLGTTPDGRRILRLPSGRVVAVRPGQPDVDLSARARRRAFIPRDADTPYQPFDGNGN